MRLLGVSVGWASRSAGAGGEGSGAPRRRENKGKLTRADRNRIRRRKEAENRAKLAKKQRTLEKQVRGSAMHAPPLPSHSHKEWRSCCCGRGLSEGSCCWLVWWLSGEPRQGAGQADRQGPEGQEGSNSRTGHTTMNEGGCCCRAD